MNKYVHEMVVPSLGFGPALCPMQKFGMSTATFSRARCDLTTCAPTSCL
jgi:hypothetical protein